MNTHLQSLSLSGSHLQKPLLNSPGEEKKKPSPNELIELESWVFSVKSHHRKDINGDYFQLNLNKTGSGSGCERVFFNPQTNYFLFYLESECAWMIGRKIYANQEVAAFVYGRQSQSFINTFGAGLQLDWYCHVKGKWREDLRFQIKPDRRIIDIVHDNGQLTRNFYLHANAHEALSDFAIENGLNVADDVLELICEYSEEFRSSLHPLAKEERMRVFSQQIRGKYLCGCAHAPFALAMMLVAYFKDELDVIGILGLMLFMGYLPLLSCGFAASYFSNWTPRWLSLTIILALLVYTSLFFYQVYGVWTHLLLEVGISFCVLTVAIPLFMYFVDCLHADPTSIEFSIRSNNFTINTENEQNGIKRSFRFNLSDITDMNTITFPFADHVTRGIELLEITIDTYKVVTVSLEDEDVLPKLYKLDWSGCAVNLNASGYVIPHQECSRSQHAVLKSLIHIYFANW